MKAPSLNTLAVLAAAIAAGGVAYFVWKKGGVKQAAAAVGGAAVDAVDGAVSGAVGGLGEIAGLPTPSQTTTDASVARWLIDSQGYFTASLWASMPALVRAAMMPAGSGTAPAPGSLLAKQFPTSQLTTGDFTRTDHDTTPVPVPFTGGASGEW